MKYLDTKEGIFLIRPNRFIARVLIEGQEEVVHVKNTGRCKELLIEGVKVVLEKSKNPNRKTAYSLIAVYKDGMLINMDSQVPNAVVAEALEDGKIKEMGNVDKIKREVTYGNSRFDIYYEKGNKKGFIEVKGVTLENNGIAAFPDAPTLRGTKHVQELIKAKKEGYEASIVFLIQMDNVNLFTPNDVTDKAFGDALRQAEKEGVNILAYTSVVDENVIVINKKVDIKLY